MEREPTRRLLEQARQLPFIEDVAAKVEHPGQHGEDAILDLRTPAGRRTLRVELVTSHLGEALVERLVGRLATHDPQSWLVFAPYVSPPMGKRLEAAGINYLDGVGNCFVVLGKRYTAKVEGRRGQVPPEQKGMRAPGYLVLFGVLAEPELLNANVREVAEQVGVGKSTVALTLERLESEGFVGRQGSSRRLLAARALLDRWLAGYADVLRPSWLTGKFRVADVPQFERAVERKAGGLQWGWSGGAAAMRLAGHYRGPGTVLCLAESGGILAGDLGMLADPQGPVSILRFEGPLLFKGRRPHTVHPLLVYAELLVKPGERSAEAAQELLERYLPALAA